MEDLFQWAAMGFLASIVLAYLAKLHEPIGPIWMVVLAVPGAMAGAYAATFLDVGEIGTIDWTSVAIAAVGAFIFIMVVNIIRS